MYRPVKQWSHPCFWCSCDAKVRQILAGRKFFWAGINGTADASYRPLSINQNQPLEAKTPFSPDVARAKESIFSLLRKHEKDIFFQF
jgi:hypothetical protein